MLSSTKIKVCGTQRSGTGALSSVHTSIPHDERASMHNILWSSLHEQNSLMALGRCHAHDLSLTIKL